MELPDAIEIFNRQNIHLGLRLIINDFMLKARQVIPTCVADVPSGDAFREKNFYYDKTTKPYRYSIEACMKSCTQNLVNTPCGVLDATFPVLNDTYENLKAEQPPISACKGTENIDVGMDQCQCPFPCRYYQYLVSSDTTELEKDVNPNCGETESEDDVTTVRRMKVSIQFLSNIYNYNEEMLDYDLTQFLGLLGGNVGLWLGLCVLSLLEVFELIWDLIFLNLKKVWCRQRNRIPSEYDRYSMGLKMVCNNIRPAPVYIIVKRN